MADDLIELNIPLGADSGPISHGYFSYAPFRADITNPNSGSRVRVPRESVDHFCLTGGFTLYEPQMRRRLSGETIDIERTDGPGGCSYDGETYDSREVDVRGEIRHVLTIPLEAAAEILGSHPGFKVHAPDAEKPAAAVRPASKLLKSDGRISGQKPFAADPEGTPHPDAQTSPAASVPSGSPPVMELQP
jgi:hypothetical protein